MSEFIPRAAAWYVEEEWKVNLKGERDKPKKAKYENTRFKIPKTKKTQRFKEVYPIINFKVDDQPEHETD